MLGATALAASLGLLAAAPRATAAPATPRQSLQSIGQTAGARLPFVPYPAIDARTDGTVIGPGTYFGTLAAEAEGREAVTLRGQGEYITFTLRAPANAVDFHYSIPDSADGAGLTAPLSLYVDGRYDKALTLTSRYSWFFGSYPFTRNPADGKGHHFYDDVRTTLDRTLSAGTTVTLKIDRGDSAPSYTIAEADFFHIAPSAAQPGGYLSVLAYGADATGVKNSTAAIQNAINAAESANTGVYLPQGTYTISAPLNVNNVTVAGAGEWYTTITGSHVEFSGQVNPASTHVDVHDLSMFGNVNIRNDSDGTVTGFNGGLSDSVVHHVWIQNEKVGMWIIGPSSRLTVTDCIIQDTTADGINFAGGVSDSAAMNNFIRNTGDDGLAMWSTGSADYADTFSRNSIELPMLANNIAIYGGHDNSVTGNFVTDTLTQGGGIHVGNRFGAVPLSGTTTISGNVLVSTGELDPNWLFGVGAIWFYALDEPMTGMIDVHDDLIVNSAQEAFQFIGSSVTNVAIRDVLIDTAGTFAVQEQSAGAADFTNVVARHLGAGGIYNCSSGFQLTTGPGDSGWADSHCGFPPNGLPVVTPGQLSFGDQTLGTTSAAKNVTVTNPGPDPITMSGITANSAFAETNDCSATLAVGATCTIDVTFSPTTTAGAITGALSINSSAPFSPNTVSLSGIGFDPNGNLALGQAATASGYTAGFPPSNAADGNADTYWESTDNAFPQWLQVDLGAARTADRIELTLPAPWGSRTQTLSVLGSTDETTFSTIVGSAGYTFDPATGNTVTITFPATVARYIRLLFTANTGWPAGQVDELEVFAH
jgi:hypothetical protein